MRRPWPIIPAVVFAGTFLMTLASHVAAQHPEFDGRYQPLNQRTPAGVAGNWIGIAGRSSPGYFQPIRVNLPSDGTVKLYNESPSRPVTLSAPALIGVALGHTYRLQISDMPEFPGIEMYPTIEILDRLHPPSGKENEFPVPVQFTRDEIEFALAGRLVTKVIFLEQPQRAIPKQLDERSAVLTLPSGRNLLAEADRLGRPMIILRLGGRLPNRHGNDPVFFGTGAPLRLLGNSQPQPPPKRKSTSTIRRPL